MRRVSKRRKWASLVPFGVGSTKPHHFTGIARVAWENRARLPYAWRILRRGVCDGCALGTKGLRDWTMDGVHLCMVRLDLLRLSTMKALDPARLADVGRLAGCSDEELRRLGRLPSPMVRRRGEPGFRTVSWERAIELVAERIRSAEPLRTAFYLTSRGIPNETYYVAQKVARALGTPHVDNSARLCHAASTTAMNRAFGHGASTGSYRDWIGADLIVFFGSNVPNNQPVTMKYLVYARRKGTEIAVVNPLREPGLERYWVPSDTASALFGTRLAEHWYEVDTGGDLAFANGVLKALLEIDGGVDRSFVEERTSGFGDVVDALARQSWEELETTSGTGRERMADFARLLCDRPNTIFVWSMGLTQHAHGVDTIQALCNLGLARGLLGRPHRGLTPIRGHSGVQGGAEVGCVPVANPAVLDRWAEVWGFDPPREPGLAAVDQIRAAASGEIDLLWMIGGNFLHTVAPPERSREALRRPGLRVHQDIVVSSAMLEEPSDLVVLLPAATRYEIPGGVTETSTERRIIFSPEIPGPRIEGARPEWEVLCEVARAARPDRSASLRYGGLDEVRSEMARAVPLYAGIENLSAGGDSLQWGGPTLFADGEFATDDGRARFVPVPLRGSVCGDGQLLVSTRRGHQFNSMVGGRVDSLTGAERDHVLMSAVDASERGLVEGDPVRLESVNGRFDGRVRLAPIKPGNLEVYWPEGQVLLGAEVDRDSGEPDYNARVTLTRAGDEAR